jgi:hypothetical protein
MLTPFLHVLTNLRVQEYSPGWFTIAADCGGQTWFMHCIYQTKPEAEQALEEIVKALPANISVPSDNEVWKTWRNSTRSKSA